MRRRSRLRLKNEAKRKEIMEEYAEKMKAAADEMELPEHPLNTLEEESAAEGEDGKGKTISLPVFYNSYFPRWRYTHFKKPEMEESKEDEEAIKELRKRSTQDLVSAPATYLPTAAQVTKTEVKPLPSDATPENIGQTVSVAAQTGVTYYPQVLPVVTRVQYPVIQYPTLLYPYPATYSSGEPVKLATAAGVEEVKHANVPASTTLIKTVQHTGQGASAPLPEHVFPIFPKADGQVEEQAALAL